MVRFAVKIAGKTGKRKQRSGRGDAGIGFAARKHTEMGLRMQRSGQERAVVGFATWGTGQAETEGWEQGKRCTGSARLTRRRWDRPRCTETGRNGPVVAAKRTGEGRCGLRGTGQGWGAGGVREEGARREGEEG